MSVTVTAEDGSGLPGANSYAILSDADAYFETRPRSGAWQTANEDQKGQFLIQATQILDKSFRWIGEPTSTGQALAFPRYSRVYPAALDGISVPRFLTVALFELALFLVTEDPTAKGAAEGLKRIEVDGLNVEVDPARTFRLPRWLSDLTAPYGEPIERSNSVPIRRA